MITTGCDGCCFLQQDEHGKGCVLKQICIKKDNSIVARGYCRLCRSDKWAKKQGTNDFNILQKKVIEERSLKFDMLVFFDEAMNTINDLDRTLSSDWYKEYAQKIIIMDVTGFGKRKNIALEYLKNIDHQIPTTIDSSVAHELVGEREGTIRRISKQVESPFFLAIPAGMILNNMPVFAQMIQYVPSRVIHWSFPFTIGNTAVINNRLDYGLFITLPYLSLMKSVQVESFTDQLRKEESETGMGLSWLCSDVWLR